MDLDEEMDDGAMDDGGYEDLSNEDYDKLMSGLEHIRAILGDEKHSPITDAEIKDALYHYYFDVEKSAAYLIEEQERKVAAQERKDGKPLPIPPPDDYADWSPPSDNGSGRHNVPFVRLTQSEYVSSSEQETTRASTRPGSLYTIAEQTEYSEDSKDWPPAPSPFAMLHGLPAGSRGTLMSSITTDYGQMIERKERMADPNEIPPSPSSSALRRLSLHDLGSPGGPPQYNWSSSSSERSSRPPTIVDLPSVDIDNIPDIPDYKSKSSLPRQGRSEVSLGTKKSAPKALAAEESSTDHFETASSAISSSATGEKTAKKSKLSQLASSRSSAKSSASSVSASSRSSVTRTERASQITYPALRPGVGSTVSLLPPRLPSIIGSDSSIMTTTSSVTRKVEQAIQSAMVFEALDRSMPPEPSVVESTVPPTPPPKSHHRFPLVYEAAQSPPRSAKSSTSSTQPSVQVPRSPPPVTPPPASSPPRTKPSASPQPRQLSKLAKLAQAKAQEQSKTKPHSPSQPGFILPRTTTEYLTPTANGATATTAITTSYQSLAGLLSKNQIRPPKPEVQPLPPMQTGPQTPRKTSDSKQSKLAMKSKSARSKQPEPEPEADLPVIEVPMFSASAIRSRAPPSVFATVLVTEEVDTVSLNGSDGVHLCQHHKAERDRRRSSKGKLESGRSSGSKRTEREEKTPTMPPSPLPLMRGFAFDSPSPDDVVFNARRGTSLARSTTVSSVISASSR
ncbi:HBS1 N-terminus-domain-containing protein [Epithele typhae]|uniref:HBS1 N-terminus-domain-containing protein n=1 Tax=Epithele typhae TaxID=378194 RepID=UPI00200848E7|nr:HBS1 N-terminus-domain-containing protein [Epithele typhae]KAH9927122.1 HBS1 N-terminus-domain-containing protein [Epithele typhae]